MAAEEIVRRQVADRAGAPLPSTSPDAFGAGLGRAVEQAAGQAHVRSIQAYQVERRARTNADASIFQASFGSAREDLTTLAREGRKSDQPGHAERLAAEVAKRREEVLQGIQDDDLRSRAAASFDDWGVRFRTGEADWEDVRQSQIVVERYDEALKLSEGRVRRLETPADYTEEVRVQLDGVEMMDVADSVKGKMRDEAEQRLAIAFMRGMTDRDPVAAKALADSGSFDGVLTGDQLDALRNGAEVEIRRGEAEAERAVALETAEFRETLRIFEAQDAQGIDQAEVLPGLIAKAEQLGLPDVKARLQGKVADAGFAKIYQGALPVQLEQRLAAINAKGAKATAAEQRERAWIAEKLPGIEGRYASDPVGFYVREGGQDAPPPLDLANPASIDARARWARAAGVGTPFTKAETSALQQQYEQGRQGEETVIAALHRLPADQAMAAARAVDPADRTLPILVTLDDNHRNLARRGREALKAKPKLLADFLKEDPNLEEEDAQLRQRFDRALVNVAPEQRRSILAAAIQLSAGAVDKNGGYATRVLDEALHTALGGRKDSAGNRLGGLQRWGDSMFLAPAGMTAQNFLDRAVKVAGAKGGPVNPDGTPANITRAVPVALNNGDYEFRTPAGQVLKKADGTVWRVRPRNGAGQ